MNNEIRKKKRQYLISRGFELPLEYSSQYIEYENGEADFRGANIDKACALKYIYLEKETEDTIFGQMLLLEIELEILEESKKQEKREEELNRIDSEIKEKKDSFKIREEYLCKKIGINFVDWCNTKRLLLNIEFWKYQEQHCISRINELQRSINENNKYSGTLKDKRDDNPTDSYYRDSFDEIEYEIRYSENKIAEERNRLETIRQAAMDEGVVL